jgi:hypothetical protein
MDARDREAVVRRSVEAWNSADWVDQLREIWDPQGMIVSPEGWPESGEFKGWDAMLGQWRRVKGSWDEERVDLIDVESVGERVLARLRWTMRGEASGAALEVDVAIVCELSQDRFSKMSYFLDHEAARAAAEAVE